eukprot:scaffold59261_cov49-Phaeocystis_antarctica.AAC.2
MCPSQQRVTSTMLTKNVSVGASTRSILFQAQVVAVPPHQRAYDRVAQGKRAVDPSEKRAAEDDRPVRPLLGRGEERDAAQLPLRLGGGRGGTTWLGGRLGARVRSSGRGGARRRLGRRHGKRRALAWRPGAARGPASRHAGQTCRRRKLAASS